MINDSIILDRYDDCDYCVLRLNKGNVIEWNRIKSNQIRSDRRVPYGMVLYYLRVDEYSRLYCL
jgi:hypothetical protein